MRLALPVLLALALRQVPATHQARVARVMNPRTANGTWVSDAGRHLRPATLDSVNAAIAALERETGAEIAVVVVDSLSGLSEQEFALAIHRTWGVGKRDRDNGVVLLWAPNERAVFISIGYGLEGAIPDRRAGRIRDRMTGEFRAGDFDRGVTEAVAALASAVREEAPSGADARMAVRDDDGGGGGVGGTGAVALGVGGIGVLFGGLAGVRRWRRRRPRACANGHPMRLVPEAVDDTELDQGQRLEEQLGSVDWDVWVCDTCGEKSRIPYRRFFTSYSDCPKCQRRTLKTTTQTIVRATTSHGGRERVTVTCRNCGHSVTSERSTPRLSSSSSGGSSGGGGGGGSSFGGGSAGGGGAGGRY